MRIEFTNRRIEIALERIADTSDRIAATLEKMTSDDFTEEDEAVKSGAAEVEAAKKRIPQPQ